MDYNSKKVLRLYHFSPYFIKNLISSYYGYRQNSIRHGKYFQRYFEFLKKSQWWSIEEIQKYNNEKTLEYVNRILKNSSYFRHKYSDIKNIEDLNNFEVVGKEILRNNTKDFISNEKDSVPFKTMHTSGTTGSSLIFPLSIECFQREYAFRALHYLWGGINLTKKDTVAYCSGHPVSHENKNIPPFWVHDHYNNWLLMSSYHLCPENLKHYISKLEDFQPKAISGYPSSIYLLALAYKKFGKKKLKPRSIFTASETLHEFQRKAIENSFQTKVYNWYGNTEMCANIVECEKGELHLKHEHSFIEILNENNQPVSDGETGRLICTAFGNPLFGLIRYDIGDIVTVSKNQNSKCGRPGIIIENIEGRIEDYIITPGGKLIGRLDHIFKNSENVIVAQIEQNHPAELIVRIVKNNHYNINDEKNILKEIKLRAGSGIKIVFDYTDSIPRGKNNKFRFIISNLNTKDLLKSMG